MRFPHLAFASHNIIHFPCSLRNILYKTTDLFFLKKESPWYLSLSRKNIDWLDVSIFQHLYKYKFSLTKGKPLYIITFTPTKHIIILYLNY